MSRRLSYIIYFLILVFSGTTFSQSLPGHFNLNDEQAGAIWVPKQRLSLTTQANSTYTSNQNITFLSTAPVNATVGGNIYLPIAIASSGLPVQITVDPISKGICSLCGGMVTFQTTGTCVLDGNQPGNIDYATAPQVQQNITVSQGTQTIRFTSASPTNVMVGGSAYTPTASATSGLKVQMTINSNSSSVCSMSNGVISFQNVGTCVINANQLGNANYAAAPQMQQSITVGKSTQTIQFSSTIPSYAPVSGPTYTPAASASSSLPVQITVDASSSSVCSISNGQITFLSAGTCLIDANQPGNANYSAATQVQQSISVISPPVMYVGTVNGAIKSSSNGGYTWTTMTQPDGNILNNVFINGTTLYAATEGGNVEVSTNNGASWTATTQPDGSVVNSVFINGSTMYAATAAGNIKVSLNGGISWTATTQPDGSAVNSVIISGTTLYAATTNGNVEISTNGGTSWTATTQPDGSAVNSIFVNGSTIYAATEAGNVEVSTNGGSSWTPTVQPSAINAPVTSVFVNGTTVYATTGDNVVVLPSGATSWTTTTSPDNSTVNSVFVNSMTLYAAGGLNVSVSINNGTTWTQLTEPDASSVYSLFASGTTLYAGTIKGNVMYSTNGGTSWTATTQPDGGYVRGIYVNGTTLYAATSKGNVRISTNGGATWTSTPTQPESGQILYSFFISGTTLYAGTANGNVQISSNGGASWTTTTPNGNGIYGIYVSGTTLYSAPLSSVCISTNAGMSWTGTTPPAGINGVESLYLIGTTIYVGVANSYVYFSTNTGSSWTQIPTKPNGSIVHALFISNFVF